MPYTTRILNPLDKDFVTEDGCWNDLAVKQPQIDKLAAGLLPARQHGVFVYSLGDEGVVAGSCLSPACLEAYRRYLREQYGTIAALNSSWGTDFADFSAVTLSELPPTDAGEPIKSSSLDRMDVSPTELLDKPPLSDNDELTALHAKNYPRWYDRVAFQRWNLVQYSRRYAEAYRKIDPRARTGFEGSGGPFFGLGADVEAIADNLGFWGPYPSQADELLRSLAPRELVRSNWMGYSKNANGLLASLLAHLHPWL